MPAIGSRKIGAVLHKRGLVTFGGAGENAGMGTLSPRQYMEILVEKCPSYQEALPSCVIAELRKEPDVNQRRKNLAAMSDDAIEELYRRHLLCICRVVEG